MKAKLIKTPEQLYKLEFYNDEDMLACATALLSKQNCDKIFEIIDVEKLAEENYPSGDDWTNAQSLVRKLAFINGINKAMELNKDKVFTEEDMRKAYFDGYNDKEENKFFNPSKSLQQPTEMDIEIEMEEISSSYLVTIGEVKTTKLKPKLDSSGCLVLTKKI